MDWAKISSCHTYCQDAAQLELERYGRRINALEGAIIEHNNDILQEVKAIDLALDRIKERLKSLREWVE